MAKHEGRDSGHQKKLFQTTTVGSWITLGHPAIAEILAKAGFDWLTVDLEHSVISLGEAENLIRVIELCGSVPLVRLSANDPVQIKRVMDAGAHGVIIPMVKTRNDIVTAVEAVHYPPGGSRGVGLARAQGYGADFKRYFEWQRAEAVVVAQIEHIKAVENLSEIFKTPGLDGFIVGPYDLSGSLGRPGDFEHPEFLDAMAEIDRVAEEVGTPGGIHIVEPNIAELERCLDAGYPFIAFSVDIRLLDVACRSGIKVARERRQ